jgi:beta-glucosidase
VSVKVTNTGTRAGKEAVELYLSDLYGSVSRPVKQLKRFSKVALAPGETKKVDFTLSGEDFSFIGRANKRMVEPGKFRVAVGGLSSEFDLQRDMR